MTILPIKCYHQGHCSTEYPQSHITNLVNNFKHSEYEFDPLCLEELEDA